MMRYTFVIIFFYLSNPLIGQSVNSTDKTKDSLESLIQKSRTSGKMDYSYINALKELSRKLMYEDLKKSVNYLNEAMEIAETLKDTIEIAAINHLLGLSYRNWGYAYAAAEYFQQSFLLSEKIGQKNIAGFDLLSIGNVYFDLKKWSEADFYFRNALQSFKEEDKLIGNAICLNNIGLTFQEKFLPDSALNYFNEALLLRRTSGDSILTAQSFWYISTALLDMKKHDKALFFANLADNYFKEYSEIYQHSDLAHIPLAIYYTKGKIFKENNLIDSAAYYWYKIINSSQPKQTEYYYSAYSEMAELESQKSNFNFALHLLKEAIDKASNTHFYDESEKLYLQIASLLEKMGKFKESNLYLRNYTNLLKNKTLSVSNQMLNFHVLFETYEQEAKLKEKELQLEKVKLYRNQQKKLNIFYLIGLIVSLSILLFVFMLYRSIRRINKTLAQKNKSIEEKNRIIETNAKELEDLNHTKDLLFSVIAHDLRSPFNALTNFSKLMQGYIKKNQWHELKNSFVILEQSSQNAYWTFENLLVWVQGQTGKLEPELKNLDILPLIEESIGIFSAMFHLKNIHFEKKLSTRYALADSYMLKTVLRNIISNAIKYSNKNGNIILQSSLENEFVKIIIEDEGIGMSENDMINLFESKNLKISDQSVNGLGLQICKQFINDMNGTIKVEKGKIKGTRFIIMLPKGENLQKNEFKRNSNTQSDLAQKTEKIQRSLELIKSYSEKFNAISVYETSAIKEILLELDKKFSEHPEISEWIKKMHMAIFLSDSNAYQELVNKLSE